MYSVSEAKRDAWFSCDSRDIALRHMSALQAIVCVMEIPQHWANERETIAFYLTSLVQSERNTEHTCNINNRRLSSLALSKSNIKQFSNI